MTLEITRHTVADLHELEAQVDSTDKRYELIEGIIVEVPPGSPLHAYMVGLIYIALQTFVSENDLGFVFPDGCGYQLSETNALIPDVSFVSRAKQPSLPLPKQFGFAPDLAVEVVSPSNSPRDMLNKVQIYLKYGTQTVWVVYPDQKLVDVYRNASDGTGLHLLTFTANDVLDSGDVLPGFTLPVHKVFPADA